MSDILQATASLATRFASYAFPEPMSGCWLWTAAVDGGGYGTIKHLGRDIKAHRASWLLAHGPIPAGLMVLHRCDLPTCVNPDHLFLGTQTENMRDMLQKGRGRLQRHPEQNHHAKLDQAIAADIRRDYVFRHPERSLVALARKYGVSPASIFAIVHGESYPVGDANG